MNHCRQSFGLTCSMLSRPVQSNLNPAPGPLAPLAPTSSRTLELNISLEHVFSETKVFNKKYTLVELYKDFVSYGLSVRLNLWSSGKEQFFSFSKTKGSRSPTTKRNQRRRRKIKREARNLTEPPT